MDTLTPRSAARKAAFLAVTAFALTMWTPSSAFAATMVSVSGRQILVNGQPLIMRGVCYQPTPIGENPSQSPPWGDYFTSNYRALYDRDLPRIRQMGANVIRVYTWDYSGNHSDFLNKAYGAGPEPIYLLLNRWIDPNSDWSNPTVVDAIKNEYRAMVANVGNHPAVLGFIIGNELNSINGANTNFWAALNSIAATVKAQAPNRLVTMSVTDRPGEIAQVNSRMTALDAWSLQVYRGASFGNLFTTYQAASAKPLLITEFGLDAFNNSAGQPFPNNAQLVADTVATLWREMRTNQTVVRGGCLFAYADEWWKASGTATNHDTGGAANAALVDGFSNEEWYGIFGVADNGANPDLLQPRAVCAKLEALWAVPATVLRSSLVNGRLQSEFFVPGGRDDLKYELEASTDMRNWTVLVRVDRGAPAELVDTRASVSERFSGATGDRTVIVLNPGTPPAPLRVNRLKTMRY